MQLNFEEVALKNLNCRTGNKMIVLWCNRFVNKRDIHTWTFVPLFDPENEHDGVQTHADEIFSSGCDAFTYTLHRVRITIFWRSFSFLSVCLSLSFSQLLNSQRILQAKKEYPFRHVTDVNGRKSGRFLFWRLWHRSASWSGYALLMDLFPRGFAALHPTTAPLCTRHH